ncbi:MAG: hypothetical protein II077_12625, partial [Treponema sp.]|nr:hypothetical protein [Treponema sp.]
VARGLLKHASEDKEFAKKLRAAEKKVLEYKISCGLLEMKKEGGSYKVCLPSVKDKAAGAKSRLEEFNAFKEKGRAFFKKYFVSGEP